LNIKGRPYIFIHLGVHLLLSGLMYFVLVPDLRIDPVKIAIIVLGTGIVDLDHIKLWKDVGIRGYLKLRSEEEFGIARKYPLHNLMLMFVAFGGSLLLLVNEYSPVGIFFGSVALHLFWDFFEDVAIFRTGYRHWI
jgi:hypothetical protein